MSTQSCVNQIDYSTVMGDRILPFQFTLNLAESVLEPEAGQFQKFCYDIKGVGEDAREFADLSHFLLGICDTITQEEIREITVVINGEQQEVIWGKNVEIKTAQHPDNPTGCTGLKFDFPLNKVNGVMRVCITFNEVFPIGATNVCVFGGNTTATGLAICGATCFESVSCTRTFFQKETVCVPVKVTPFATPGGATATCCGEPRVVTDGQCVGNRTSCNFVVTQTLCIEIPIQFGAEIETGDAVVQCGDVSEHECDCSVATTKSTLQEEMKTLTKENRYYR